MGENFRQDGIASWYGYEFDGRPTASGEIFNSSQLTAAHPTLPFGTYLLVTNRQNNRQVAVKVNDRGPFVPSRIVDVSRAAAEQLDMLITGTAPVTIEKISANHVFMQSPQQPQIIYQQQPQVIYQQQPPAQMVYPQQPIIPRLPPQSQMQMLPPMAQGPMMPPQQLMPPIAQGPMLPPQQFQTPNLIPTPPPFPPQEPPAAPSINVTVYTPQQSPSIAPNPMDLPGGPRARLSPSITPSPNKIYKLQIGSYKVAGNAVEAYVKLKAAGLDPSYERNADYFRVVLAGVRGTDIAHVTEKLGTAGFREAVIREEY
jgi:rare lipoprotein A